jgi:hypothetical protein
MTADTSDLNQLKRHHQARKAPSDAQALAVARFRAGQTKTNRWNWWGAGAVAASVLCVVLFIPGETGDAERSSEPVFGAAGLSLNQVALPPRPSLQTITGLSASELSASTNLPLAVPNLSQLSVSRIEDKETI